MEIVKTTRQQRRAAARKASKENAKIIKATGGIPKLEPSERINIYSCQDHEIITIDRFKGTTPMVIKCPHCGKPALSRWYKVDQALEPKFEWTQPDPEHIRFMPLALQEHVMTGGLIFQEIKKEQ